MPGDVWLFVGDHQTRNGWVDYREIELTRLERVPLRRGEAGSL
jgi:hypothetical protein